MRLLAHINYSDNTSKHLKCQVCKVFHGKMKQMAIKQDIKKWYNSELKGHSLIYKVLYIGGGIIIYGLGIITLCFLAYGALTGLSGMFSNKNSSHRGVRCAEYEWDSHGGRTCIEPESEEDYYDEMYDKYIEEQERQREDEYYEDRYEDYFYDE